MAEDRNEPGAPAEHGGRFEESTEKSLRGSGAFPVAQATPVAFDQRPDAPAGLIAEPAAPQASTGTSPQASSAPSETSGE